MGYTSVVPFIKYLETFVLIIYFFSTYNHIHWFVVWYYNCCSRKICIRCYISKSHSAVGIVTTFLIIDYLRWRKWIYWVWRNIWAQRMGVLLPVNACRSWVTTSLFVRCSEHLSIPIHHSFLLLFSLRRKNHTTSVMGIMDLYIQPSNRQQRITKWSRWHTFCCQTFLKNIKHQLLLFKKIGHIP